MEFSISNKDLQNGLIGMCLVGAAVGGSAGFFKGLGKALHENADTYEQRIGKIFGYSVVGTSKGAVGGGLAAIPLTVGTVGEVTGLAVTGLGFLIEGTGSVLRSLSLPIGATALRLLVSE